VRGVNLRVKLTEFKVSIKNFWDRMSKGIKITIMVTVATTGFIASVITILSSQQVRLFFKRLTLIFWSLLMIKMPIWIIGLIIIGFLLIYINFKKKKALGNKKISTQKEEKEQNKNPGWREYKEDTIKGNRFRWEYENSSQPEIKNLQQVCKKCGCELNSTLLTRKPKEKKKKKKQEKPTYEEALGALRNIHFGRVCPNCGSVYELEPNMETIKKLIRHNIRTENYKHSEIYPIKEQN